MKSAEVELPDAVYQQVELLASELHMSVPEFLRRAAEHMIQASSVTANPDWHFPEGLHLGNFAVPVEDWRLHANETENESK